MIHLFIDQSAIGPLGSRNFSINDKERKNYVVDIVPLSTTYVVKYDSQTKLYSAEESIRDDRGDWNSFKTGVTISDVSIEEADDTQGILELLLDKNMKHKSLVLAFFMARQVENYLYESGFFNSNPEPDEELGGIYITANEDILHAEVVYGKDRPDMMYVPYKVTMKDIGYVNEAGDPEMGRPYHDEFMERLRDKLKISTEENNSEEDYDTEDDDFIEDEWMDDFEDEDEEWFINKLGRFYGDVDTLNSILMLETTQSDTDLIFAVEIIDLPYTVIYTPSSAEIQMLVKKNLSGLSGVDEADAFVLVAERTELGSMASTIKAAVTINHNGEIKGGSNTLDIGHDRLGAFMNIARKLNDLLHTSPFYKAYQEMDAESSGMMLSVCNDMIDVQTLIGKNRPDLVCTTLFGEVQMMRPYEDEITDSWMAEMLPLEEKIELAENGDEDMMERLALNYLNGDEVDADAEKAVYWFTKLAELNHSDAQFNLALHYAKGYGVNRDFAQAAYWMQKAYENGDMDAQALVIEFTKVVEAEKKAKGGDAQAQADLAHIYMFMAGSLEQAGVGDDYAISFDYATKAAAQNNGDGLWTLALAYEHGRGVDTNKEKAVELYRKGAELGHAPSQHSLACYYLRGEIVEENKELGFELSVKSAKQGYALAMRTVGSCYQFGDGVQDDMKLAIEWYEKYLELEYDPELEQKVSIFKILEAGSGFGDMEEDAGWDYEQDNAENDWLPPSGMEEAIDLWTFAEEAGYDIGDDNGVFSIDENLIAFVTEIANSGDERAQYVLAQYVYSNEDQFSAEQIAQADAWMDTFGISRTTNEDMIMKI